jgi:hypothetical protein
MKSTFKNIFVLLAIYLLSIGSASAEAALVIGIEDCVLLDGNGDIAWLDTGSGITVSANSSNGNIMHTCSADVTPPATGRTAIFNFDNTGLRCGIDDGIGGNLAITDDWHQVVNSDGKAKVVCHFKN